MAQDSNSDKPINAALIESGLQQGSLLPLLPYLVLFDPNERASSISRPITDIHQHQPKTPDVPRHAYGASVPSKAGEQLIVISQTCDIARATNIEPCVLAARVFVTGDQREIAMAQVGSVRKFMLRRTDDKRAMIVDLTSTVLIEKPVLRGLKHEFGPPDAATARAFRRWVGERFSRPDFPDGFVAAVIDPIGARLQEISAAGDPRLYALERVLLRTPMPDDAEPFPVNVVALIPPESDTSTLRTDLLSLLLDLSRAVDRKRALEPRLDVRSLDEFSATQLLSTESFPLGG
ncbi:hypothetical protein EPN52_02010 [bacterium]|nr:MAG: hypothetical protein EPN52_02010 [bacterium]